MRRVPWADVAGRRRGAVGFVFFILCDLCPFRTKPTNASYIHQYITIRPPQGGGPGRAIMLATLTLLIAPLATASGHQHAHHRHTSYEHPRHERNVTLGHNRTMSSWAQHLPRMLVERRRMYCDALSNRSASAALSVGVCPSAEPTSTG